MDRILILGARRYSFLNEGERVEGVKVSYCEACEIDDDQTIGGPAMSITAGLDIWGLLKGVPGIFDVKFGRRPGARGKPETIITSATFVKSLDLEKLLAI